MLASGMNLVTTVIGFGMSATFIVFVCARLICGRVRSADSHAATLDIELRSDIDPREHTIGGLEPVVVAAIPTMKYNRDTFCSTEDAQCSICLGEYQEKEILRIMPACSHNFHLTCIDVWLQKQSTCPICRLPLNDTFEAKHADSPFRILQPVRRALHSDYHNQRILPGTQNRRVNDPTQNRRVNDPSQEIHESLSVIVETPPEEEERRR